MATEPDRIRDDIEATRADLTTKVDMLADRTSPTRVAQRKWSNVKESARSVSERVMGAPKHAAGSTKEGASNLSDKASDAAAQLSDKASGAAAQIGDKASGAAHQAADVVRQAPDAVTQRTQGNPLAAGLIAFGAGLLAGTLLPTTGVERRAGQQLRERGPELVEPIKAPLQESAQRIKEQVTDTARDAAEDVKQTARDAALNTADQAKQSAQATADQAKQSGQATAEHAKQAGQETTSQARESASTVTS
jgi:gas vesicle protein